MSILAQGLAAAHIATTQPELLGFTAAFCTTVAFIPQLVRVIRRRSARDVSLPTFLLFSIGVFLWLVYGIAIGSRPVIASNGLTLLLSVSILALKICYDRRASEGMLNQPEMEP
ncbi:MAG TPA: SemiSWEET transporter [Acidobacteriaceae bacterium]|nr:SemiSWEET transporter [Acidobacteriaceae bacterium]